MIQLGIDNTKRLYLISGRTFAGEKGTTGTVEMPTMFGGIPIGEFDICYIYVNYGGSFIQIELSGLTGTQSISFPDSLFLYDGQINIWAELQDTAGNIVQKTNLLHYIIEASQTYEAPAAAGDNPGAGEE